MRWLAFILLALIVALQYPMWLGKGGWLQVRETDRQMALQREVNAKLKLRNDALDGAFLKGAEAAGLTQLKGHRSVGGMRASIYNAMPQQGVQALVEYMREFERKHG